MEDEIELIHVLRWGQDKMISCISRVYPVKLSGNGFVTAPTSTTVAAERFLLTANAANWWGEKEKTCRCLKESLHARRLQMHMGTSIEMS